MLHRHSRVGRIGDQLTGCADRLAQPREELEMIGTRCNDACSWALGELGNEFESYVQRSWFAENLAVGDDTHKAGDYQDR